MAQLFDTPECVNLVGQYIFCDNKTEVKLESQSLVRSLITISAFNFPDGAVNSVGSVYNGTDPDGYQILNNVKVESIVGGSGRYLNVKGTVFYTALPDNLVKYSLRFQ